MTEHSVVLITTGSIEEGRRIARALVEQQLVACVNIISPIESVYRWQGAMQDDREVLLVAKTTTVALDRLGTLVRQLHGYDTPEIIALPIIAGAEDYLRWIDEATQSSLPAPRRRVAVRRA